MMKIHIKSKNMKKMPTPTNLKIKQSLCHSFLELILLLTYYQWLTVLYQISLNVSLSQYSWWFRTFFNDLSAPYCKTFSTHSFWPQWAAQCKGVCQNNVRKKQIFPNIYTFHTSCEVRYLQHLLGEKLTHFLIFSFSPHPSHPSIISAPINHNSLNSRIENDHKTYPLKWMKWEKLDQLERREREIGSLRGCGENPD
jgi:hypothetical protein